MTNGEGRGLKSEKDDWAGWYCSSEVNACAFGAVERMENVTLVLAPTSELGAQRWKSVEGGWPTFHTISQSGDKRFRFEDCLRRL